LRKPNRYLKEFIGNTSSVGIALNPDLEQWNLLATVGRDGFIKVTLLYTQLKYFLE
jgi:hypothetical protein